jgi:hypothetical protein
MDPSIFNEGMGCMPPYTPPDRRNYSSDVDGVTTKIDDRESFLAAFAEICHRRDNTNPCWKNATYFIKDSASGVNQFYDLLLESSEIDYNTVKNNAMELWTSDNANPDDEAAVSGMHGDEKQNCLHMRRSFAEFIYNCLSNDLGDKILTVLEDEICYDGPMVWLTLMDLLFSTGNGPIAFLSSMETGITDLRIVGDKYLEYSFKIQNRLRLAPALKIGTNVIDTICSVVETHRRSFPLSTTLNTTTDIVLGNAFGDLFPLKTSNDALVGNASGQFHNNWDKLEKLHKLLEWNEKIEQEKYPEDCYSFLSLYRPYHQNGLTAYSFGLMVWVFQMTLVLLMLVSVSV